MVPVSLYDEVALETAPAGVSVDVDVRGVPGGMPNTCYRAAVLYRKWAGAPPGVRIRLRKRIPVQAGLGGGSSDSAAVLKGLAALTGKSPPSETVRSLGAAVGADVPFFTLGVPALVEGYGEILTPVEWEVPFFAVIVKPAFGLSTREGYERLGRAESGPPQAAAPPAFREWADVAAAVENDFEAAWEGVRPEISRIKKELLAEGAEAAGLSGSGSAVFGLFRREGEAARAKRALERGPGRMAFVARNI